LESLLSFLETNSIYIVFVIVLLIWIGIFLYIQSTDNRLKKIEKELKEEANEK
jgi:CcmD family protein